MSKNKKEPDAPVSVTNHQAGRDYFILRSLEVGIVLGGCEVKSLRGADASFNGSFARLEGEGLFLYNLYIAPFAMGNRENPEDPSRPRKLLAHRNEIERLRADVQQKGLALVPLKIYFKHGLAKVELAVGQGKKHHDRRADIKERESQRQIDRAIKLRNRK